MKQQRFVAVVPPRKAMGKIPAIKGAGVIISELDGIGTNPKEYTFEGMDDVRLFLQGKFPTKWRNVEPAEDVSDVIPLHRQLRSRKKEELEESFAGHHPSQLTKINKRGGIGSYTTEIVTKVACEFAGVESGDRTASFLGSTGALVLGGLIHQIEKGVSVFGITHFAFTAKVPDCPDENRALEMAKLLATNPGEEIFYPVFKSNLAFLRMSAIYNGHIETQENRLAQGNRVRAAAHSSVFYTETLFTSGDTLETIADQAVEIDPSHCALLAEENSQKKALEKALQELPIYVALRECTPGAAAGILAPILSVSLTVKRFPRMGMARMFWGVALKDGKFMRKKAGSTLGYSPVCRQAFYQFGQQCIKKNAGYWSDRYYANVAMYKARHPHPVFVELIRNTEKGEGQREWIEGRRFPMVPDTFREVGTVDKKVRYFKAPEGEIEVKKGYTFFGPKHLMNMALWRTLTEFADWLYWFWRQHEGLPSRPPKTYPPEHKEMVEKTAAAWFAQHPPKVPKGYRPKGAQISADELKAAA